MQPWHLLRSWDSLLRPCWLLHARTLTPSLQKAVRRAAALHFHHDREVGALVFEPRGFQPVTQAFQKHPAFPGWCTRCWEGDACEHWDLGTLQDEGYGAIRLASVQEAAERLGLKWPWTKDQVARAFRTRALCAHPDQGGSDAAMRRLLEDRDRLLERCAVLEGHVV